MKTVIITEKPKVSQKIAYALSEKSVRKRYGKASYHVIKENGDETYVVSAAGHLYSLGQETAGFEYPVFDISWKPIHELEKSKYYTKNYIDSIASISKGVDRFIIATDWDIEGELLGYNALRFSANVTTAKRMRFSTLVSSDLKRAYENLDELDIGLVEAGETRHIMDWYWGINISRALMHAVRSTGRKFSLSAGRVQTPALSLLVKRERDIGGFVPEKFYELFATIDFGGNNVVGKHKRGRFSDKDEAKRVLTESTVKEANVAGVVVEEKMRYPPVPFDLGELQSEAYRVFRFSPKRTQQIAQSLYESGLISYPRTSSQKYPYSIGFKRILENISRIKGFEIASRLLEKEKLRPRQGKKDDPAHPAIFPTGQPPKSVSKEEEKLYGLIVHRFMSAFAKEAVIRTTNVEVVLGQQPYVFSGTEVVSIGWMEFYPYTKVEEKTLPQIAEGGIASVSNLEIKEGETEPPKRYNPASLIRELEKRELGTKATRAEIVDTLYRRGYVDGIPITVTGAGITVVDALEKYVPAIVNEELTRRFESYVEKIRIKELSKDIVLKEAREELEKIVRAFKEKEKEIGEVLGDALENAKRKREYIGKCLKCEGELRIIRSKKTGKSFVGCSKYPACTNSFPLPQKRPVSPTDKICARCGLPMISVSFGRKRVLKCIDFNCKVGQKR